MQAIITKYIPATNHKPSRIKASCERGHGYFSAQDHEEWGSAHRAACDALCARFDAEDSAKYGSTQRNWSKPKASGQIPDGRFVFCFIADRVAARRPDLELAARAFMDQPNASNRAALRKALA